MSDFDPESVDLQRLSAQLTATFAGAAVRGPIVGRTAIRDLVARELSCTVLDAERLVDTLITRGFVRYAEPDGVWLFRGAGS